MRMNNLWARLKVNEWLQRTGVGSISGELSYEEFATELRKITANGTWQAPFVDRAQACAYIRHVASNNGVPVSKSGAVETISIDEVGPVTIGPALVVSGGGKTYRMEMSPLDMWRVHLLIGELLNHQYPDIDFERAHSEDFSA